MDQNRRICDQFCSMCLRYFDVDIELGTENLETSADFYRHLQVTCAPHSLLNRVYAFVCEAEPRISIERSLGQFLFAIIFLFLCILLFAVVGQGLFAGVKRGPGAVVFFARIVLISHVSTGITGDSNFDDSPHAILLLFKIATGER